ncbi:MAG: DUF262 domain-containing protein [Polyangia bacterium]
MNIPSYASEPQVLHLPQLLDEVRRGLVQVPRFQRPFIWTAEQRIELLRSIRDGIPIGGVMIWRTALEIATYDSLGRYALSPPSLGPGVARQYLIDGVQRISTLLAALYLPAFSTQVRDEESPLYVFDLDDQDFRTLRPDEKPSPSQLPLTLLFDGPALMKFQRKLDSDERVEAADNIAMAFRYYKIAVVPIVTDDLVLVTRTFQRVNSQGTPMGEIHMVHALTYSTGFDLLNRLDALKRERLSPMGWDTVEDDWVLDVCKAHLDLDLYKASEEELAKRLRARPEVVDQAIENLGRAARFLRDDCFIPSPEWMPYALQAVLLADALRLRPEPDAELRKKLHAWFWLTTYAELPAVLNSSRARRVLAEMRTLATHKHFNWPISQPFLRRSLPQRFDFRNARSKGLVPLLASYPLHGPIDVMSMEPIDSNSFLRDIGRRAICHIIPPLHAGEFYNSPANRYIGRPEHERRMYERLNDDIVRDDFLRSHIISVEAFHHLQLGNPVGFLKQRLLDLNALEEKASVLLLGLTSATEPV